MNKGCYESSDLGRIHDLPADHPHRDHQINCTRCRTRLASYDRFLALGEQRPDEVEIEAEKKLTVFLKTEILDSSCVNTSSNNKWKMPRKFSFPLATAAVLLISFGVFQTDIFRETQPPTVVLRAGEKQAAERPLNLGEISLTEDNQIKLTWQADTPETIFQTPEAIFQVVIYDGTLAPIATLSPSQKNELYLDSDPWLAKLSQGSGLFWRVQIILNGDVLQESYLEPLTVP